MKRTVTYIITVFAALCLAASCHQIEFDLGNADSLTQMYLESVVSAADTTFLFFRRALPLGADRTAEEDSTFPEDYTMEQVEVRADGRDVPVFRKDKTHWYFTGNYAPGTEISLTARPARFDPVSARTTVPEPPVIRKIKTGIDGGLGSPAVRIELSLAGEVSSRDRFALVVRMESTEKTYAPDGSLVSHRKDTSYLSYTKILEDQYMERVMPGRSRISLEYPLDGRKRVPLLLLHSADIPDGVLSERYPTRYDQEAKYDDGSRETLSFRFRCSLYRLSPELYNYLAAQYNNGHSNSTPYGLSPVNSTYSNVSGGYGIFGALSAPAETPWLDNPAK